MPYRYGYFNHRAERGNGSRGIESGLGGMLSHAFGSSPFLALDAAWPGRFKPWELPNAPVEYWAGPDGRKHAIAAIRWTIEEKLGWSEHDVKQHRGMGL